MKFTDEQESIIRNAKPGRLAKLLLVDACPGSGKTSTCLGISKRYPESSVVMFTFNRQLAAEVREKIFKNELDENTCIYTYHGYGYEFYDNNMVNDEVMFTTIQKNKPPIKPTLFCDILIIDECQDMKPLFYRFLKKVICDFARHPKTIVILGDKMQGIYEFLGSDVRFLTHAEHLYPEIKNVRKFTLSVSHRLTEPMADFINKGMIGMKKIVSHRKSSHPVLMINANPFQMSSSIDFILKELGVKPTSCADDFFFLFPSTNMRYAQELEHKLVDRGIRVVVARSDVASLDEKVIQKKAVICSFHQSKGRERKNVVVFGFDESYFQYYARDFDPSVCPPTLFVAASRALERLILVKSSKANHLPFLDHVSYEYINLDPKSVPSSSVSSSSSSSSSLPPKKPVHKFSPSSITAFVKQETVLEISKIFDECYSMVVEKHVDVNFENTVIANDNATFEDVSDLNGITIPFIFECLSKSSIHECTVMREVISKKSGPMGMFIEAHERKYVEKRKPSEFGDFFFYANLYRSVRTNFKYYVEQLDNYTYLESEVQKLLNNLRRHIRPSPYLSFERPLFIQQEFLDDFLSRWGLGDHFEIQIDGAVVDIFDGRNVYEIKCVDKLLFEHKLQLLLYAWLFPGKEYWLLNARNGQLLQLKASGETIERIVYLLLKSKFIDKEERLEDDAFISRTLEILPSGEEDEKRSTSSAAKSVVV